MSQRLWMVGGGALFIYYSNAQVKRRQGLLASMSPRLASAAWLNSNHHLISLLQDNHNHVTGRFKLLSPLASLFCFGRLIVSMTRLFLWYSTGVNDLLSLCM